MADTFLTTSYYGNTVAQWAVALMIIVGALVVGKTLYWIFKGIARSLTSRTKTKLDDIILDMIEEPIIFAVTLMGIWYGLRRLNLPEVVDSWIGNGIQFLVVPPWPTPSPRCRDRREPHPHRSRRC